MMVKCTTVTILDRNSVNATVSPKSERTLTIMIKSWITVPGRSQTFYFLSCVFFFFVFFLINKFTVISAMIVGGQIAAADNS